MGTYLSAPVVEKESSDGTCQNFTYGVSSMQGWRVTQEDAHNCIPDFDNGTSLFAVYDGHGGAEVAKYCADNLPDFIKTVDLYKEGKLGDALQHSFLGFDDLLRRDDVIQQLKVLAGVDDDEEEDPEFMATSETDMLVAEANMPIEELMAKYSSAGPPVPQISKLQKEKQPSPMIKAKKEANQNSNNGDTNSSNSESQDPLRMRLDEKLENGQPDNDNNINVEKELREAEESVKGNLNNNKAEVDSSVQDSEADVKPAVDNKENSEADSTSSVKADSKPAEADIHTSEAVKSEQVVSSTSSEGLTLTSSSSVVAEASGSGVASSSSSSSAGSSESKAGGSGPSSSTSGTSSAGSSGSGSSSASSSSAASSSSGPSGSGVQAGGSGLSSSKKTIMEEDFDSEDSSEEEEDEEYNSDEMDDDDDDDEDEEDEEDEELGPGGIFGSRAVSVQEEDHTEEPGSDSGCTAVLALIHNKQLVVANAGDSRCVLCRGGTAVDLSVDHKPEDESERSRIEAAGGKVTSDGRVNGGLNLSRAMGDHFYKRNTDKDPKDQMISALPDIDTATLGDEDEFIVIACDGIWNFMTSQEVVDFVRLRLKNEQKRAKPSIICEELFDNCLAPNTMGDGTGCDNMTCIIVVLKSAVNDNSVQTSAKRNADELDSSASEDHQAEKRVKVDDGEADSTGS